LAFPPEGEEPLSGDRRQLDELAIQIAGVEDRVEASEWVDRLYDWVRAFVGGRVEVEDIAVANRSSLSQTARLRSMIEQAVSSVDSVPTWVSRIDSFWQVVRLPEDRAEASRRDSCLV
jgi:hypothetical protein